MLIRFTVENYLSFNNQTSFDMINTNNDINDPNMIKKNNHNLLHGYNGSGKSNLINAILFATNCIINGTDKNKNIIFNHFKLHDGNNQKTSSI